MLTALLCQGLKNLRTNQVVQVTAGAAEGSVYSDNSGKFCNTSGKWGKYTFSTQPCSISRYFPPHNTFLLSFLCAALAPTCFYSVFCLPFTEIFISLCSLLHIGCACFLASATGRAFLCSPDTWLRYITSVTERGMTCQPLSSLYSARIYCFVSLGW